MTTVKSAKLYIFDMDGTILDSMPEWEHLGRNYLISQGIFPPDNLEKTIDAMTLEESAVYFRQLGLAKETSSIIQEILSYLEDKYRFTIPAKPGMLSLVHSLYKQGHTLCLLTTSEEVCTRIAMKRLGILDYFHSIYTCSALGLGKNTGEIYQKVCSFFQISPEDSVVFEDALYAVRSAREAGCFVYAVPDPSNQKDWLEIKGLANQIYISQP